MGKFCFTAYLSGVKSARDNPNNSVNPYCDKRHNMQLWWKIGFEDYISGKLDNVSFLDGL